MFSILLGFESDVRSGHENDAFDGNNQLWETSYDVALHVAVCPFVLKLRSSSYHLEIFLANGHHAPDV